MSELKITGNPNPTVGKEEFYSVNELLPSFLPFPNLSDTAKNPFEQSVEWSIHVLENGRWIQKEANSKTGKKVSYKFGQISLERSGIRILAKRGNQVARLDIKTQKAESPKIDSIEFFDKNGNKPTKPFAYGQTLKARVHCLHMENRKVYATLWEDDAAGAGHDKANEKNKMKTLSATVKGGIADIDFVLEPDFAKIANAVKAKGDSDEGKTHEYYVTAEILNKTTVSANTNVANPSYKDTTTKTAAPKKETPAQKKGPSNKQEKEKSIGENIIDWIEDKIKIDPIVLPNPIENINSVIKIFQPGQEKEDEKKDGCYCNSDLTIQNLKDIGISDSKATEFIEAINKTFTDYQINTCLRKVHFLAQVIHESGGFRYTAELNVPDTAYDGYKGRGLIQLTGEANYTKYGTYENQDFISSLENKIKLEKLPYSARSAGWFWKEKANLNDDADLNDHIYITRIINGGYNGYNDRVKYLKKGFKTLYDNCKNDSGKNTDFTFNKSKSYNDKRGAFAWGLWHDPDLNKTGCTKDKEKAIDGYSRFIDLVEDDYAETNWYNIKNISSFSNLKYTVRQKNYVKVLDAAKQRLNELRD